MSIYEVYTAQYAGQPNHIGIWVQTHLQQNKGDMFHVTGNILMGMVYEHKVTHKPESSLSFVPGTKRYKGWIYSTDLNALESVCRSIDVPGSQLALNGKPLNPSVPIRRCTEWTAEAVTSLLAQEILHTEAKPCS